MSLYRLCERKKVNDLSEIYDGQELLIKEFINLDLSNIDLSKIPSEKWESCIFYNTSFKNTKIKFIPNKLSGIPQEDVKKSNLKFYYNESPCMYYCDFSDNDLTYLKHSDFKTNKEAEVYTYGCDFSNTGINFLKTLINVVLDSSYTDYDFNNEYWKFESGTPNWPDFIDTNTIIKNSFLKVPSFRILNAIADYVNNVNKENKVSSRYNFNSSGKIYFEISGGDLNYKKNIVTECEKILEYDKQGYGKKLYNKLAAFMSLDEKLEFFRFSIRYLNIKNIDFEDIPVEVLRYYTIKNNRFENVTINYSINDLLRFWGGGEYFLDTVKEYENKYIQFYLPNINYSSWQENKNAKRRVSDSAITFFTKVYLELSRDCNGNCPFCRNHTFNQCEYNLENIKNTLYTIKNYLNAVVIGGGEPTLRLEEVKKLKNIINDKKIDWHMFSNGTNPTLINDDYIMDNFKLNISRHAVNDEENANIFGVDSKKIMTTKDLEKLNIRNKEVTLNAVCFKGGLDDYNKIINYIEFAKEIGCKKVLIQDLQKEISLGNNIIKNNDLYIDENIFYEVRKYLKDIGYIEKYPAYSTGGYVAYILKDKENFSIAIQKYIDKKELDKEWPKSIKRIFDLSIDPIGNLYENWNQTTGLVKKK